MMLNTATLSAAASAAATAGATSATPVQNADARPDQAAQPFAAWLGGQAQAAALAVQAVAPVPADGATDDASAPASAAAPAAADDAGDDVPAAAPQDGALLAAMAMPLMPLSAAQVAQAVQAAQPSGAQSGTDDSRPAAAASPSTATPSVASQAVASQAVASQAVASQAATNMAASAAPDRAAAEADSAAQPSVRRAATADRGPALPQAQAVPAAAPARADQAPADAVPAARFAVHAQADSGSSAGADGGSEHAGGGNGAPAGAADRAVLASAAATQPVASAPLADTVKLAGPPTAWRQSLQEALGERLNVQVGKNMEQAVIRLEPPQLGRIDIAIRHSAGTLEVNISATNGEVLRQLQTVSESLRSDLSQRQFTDVAVTVMPAPKNGAAPFGDPQQGRGRQQDRDQEDKQPGRGLAEASNNPSAFSLNGRE